MSVRRSIHEEDHLIQSSLSQEHKQIYDLLKTGSKGSYTVAFNRIASFQAKPEGTVPTVEICLQFGNNVNLTFQLPAQDHRDPTKYHAKPDTTYTGRVFSSGNDHAVAKKAEYIAKCQRRKLILEKTTTETDPTEIAKLLLEAYGEHPFDAFTDVVETKKSVLVLEALFEALPDQESKKNMLERRIVKYTEPTLLHVAVRNENSDMVKTLLQQAYLLNDAEFLKKLLQMDLMDYNERSSISRAIPDSRPLSLGKSEEICQTIVDYAQRVGGQEFVDKLSSSSSSS